MKPKKHVFALALAAAALLSAAAAHAAPAVHPDGNVRTFRGWGATTVTANSYGCALYNELGIKVGTSTFNEIDGTHTISVAGGTFTAVSDPSVPLGAAFFVPIDTLSFPEIPARFQNGNYELLVVSARAEDGANIDVTAATGVFRDSGVVEARCVYIVPKNATPDNPNKLPVFCLNCILAVS